MQPDAAPTERFANRVEEYVKYRPSYPPEVLPYLREAIGLRADHVIADIGSGTGISTRIFLENGNTVYAVEPNDPMRRAAELALSAFPNFISVAATAEATTLDASSIDVIVAGQAFHWFDIPKTLVEWKRILRRDGWMVLMWNDRLVDTSAFLKDYEALLFRHGTDYAKVAHRNVEAHGVPEFFGANGCTLVKFPNRQDVDFDGLRGRLMSSSYVPAAGTAAAERMLEDLRIIFDRHRLNGHVSLEYRTNVYTGRPA